MILLYCASIKRSSLVQKNLNGEDNKNVANGSTESKVMENGRLLSLPQHRQTQPISLFIFVPQPKPSPIHFHLITYPHLRFPLITSTTRSRRRDFNAENFPPQNFNRQDDEEENDGDEEEDGSFYGKNLKRKRRWWSKKPKLKKKKSRNVFDEVIESVWILKVTF